MSYITTLLTSKHEKASFSCGNEMLDEYLHKQAKQDVKRQLSACFVLADSTNHVNGYYTLSNSSIPRTLLPDEIIKKLPPSYTNLPVTLLGRLAVEEKQKGQGFGALLLIDALKRSYDTAVNSIASMAVIVDPIDDHAIKFYSKYGFHSLPGSGKMYIPMATIAQLLKNHSIQ